MDTILHDLRFALRTLRRNRGFTIAAVLTLALGIGANAAIFSVVNSVLLRPLPYAEPERLITVWGNYESIGRAPASLPDFRDWRAGTRAVPAMGARYGTAFTLTGVGEPEQINADRVTANFFALLGVRPALGRGFLAEEEQVGGNDDVVVLSHGFWQRRFAGDSAVLGRTLQLSGRAYTVVGIAPERFVFWRPVDAWAPFRVDTADAGRRSEYLTVFGRLAPGTTIERAAADLSTVAQQLARQYPETNASWTKLEAVSLRETLVGDVRTPLLVFMGAVGLVLLIACANVANLLLARAASREREVAVRTALGAGRGRLVRQLLTESVLLALLGAGAGLLLAYWAVDALRLSGTTLVPRVEEVSIDATVLLFAVALAVVTGLLFGLAPALRVGLGDVHGALKDGARGGTGGRATRLRSALVLGEVAVALMLLVGAGLLVRSFDELNRVEAGFEPAGVLTFGINLPVARYDSIGRAVAAQAGLLERLRAMPGVQGVALSNTLPLQGAGYWSFSIAGRPEPAPGALQDAQPFTVTHQYFDVHGIRLVQGRLLEAGDVDGRPPVAVVNEQMVRQYFQGREPIGARVTFGDPRDTSTTWLTIVGVVEDVAYEGMQAPKYAQVYRSRAQFPGRSAYVSIRTTGEPATLVAGARAAVKAVDPNVPLVDVKTMEERLGESLAQPRVSVALLGVFAGVAVLLAAIGIYGVLSYAVTQRTREIGIRLALGASTAEVVRLVVRQGMLPAVIGVAVGVAGALLGTRLMSSLLFGVTATDPLTYAAVALFLTAVAFVASWVPAMRATRVEPVTALRQD